MGVRRKKIGILALQGNYEQHASVLLALLKSSSKYSHVDFYYIRKENDINETPDALIIPGGESSTLAILMENLHITKKIKMIINQDTPVFSTCAGVILLAKTVEIKNYSKSIGNVSIEKGALNIANITVLRNAYGRQNFSFFARVSFLEDKIVEGMFIRAPIISNISRTVTVLANYHDNPVIIKEKNMLMSTFHPEAVEDMTLHKYFLDTFVM